MSQPNKLSPEAKDQMQFEQKHLESLYSPYLSIGLLHDYYDRIDYIFLSFCYHNLCFRKAPNKTGWEKMNLLPGLF